MFGEPGAVDGVGQHGRVAVEVGARGGDAQAVRARHRGQVDQEREPAERADNCASATTKPSPSASPVTRHRDWGDGNHPGCWLRDYKEQIWLFNLEWTNNCSEQAAKVTKRHQAVSGYWHTPRTLARWCRIRSHLVRRRGSGHQGLNVNMQLHGVA